MSQERDPKGGRFQALLGDLDSAARSLATAARKAKQIGDPATAPARLVEALRSARSRVDRVSQLTADLKVAISELDELSERCFFELETDLRSACEEREWAVHGEWPTLYLERAIPVAVDVGQRRVTVARQRLRAPVVAEIVEALEPMIADLIPRGFDPTAFMADLARAYDQLATPGEQVPILDLYRQYVIQNQKAGFWADARTGSFRGISVEEFRARFTRLLENRVETTDGRQLRLLPPLDPRDGLFVFQPAEDRFGWIGRVEFSAVT